MGGKALNENWRRVTDWRRRPGFVILKGYAFKKKVLQNRFGCEREVYALGRLCGKGTTIVDIGANLGLYLLYWGQCVAREGIVVAVEPVPSNAEVCSRVGRYLYRNQVCVRQVALSDRVGKEKFTVPISSSGKVIHTEGSLNIPSDDPNFSTGRYGDIQEYLVDVVTLDSLNLRNVSGLKIDAEGNELGIVRGGCATIDRCRPAILCEIEERWTRRYGYMPSDLVDVLHEAGYCMLACEGKNQWRPVDQVSADYTNYLFVHETKLVDAFAILGNRSGRSVIC